MKKKNDLSLQEAMHDMLQQYRLTPQLNETRVKMLASMTRNRLSELPGVQVLDRGEELCGIVTAYASHWTQEVLQQQLHRQNINCRFSTLAVAQIDFPRKGVTWALRVSPQASTAEFDGRFPQGADYVIVPAVHEVKNAALIGWVQSQARKGATIVGVCDGVWVLAHAGLLRGKQAVGHWYALDDLQQQFADTRWRRDRRYLADGKVITTTGVTASIPVSLALVEAIAGTAAAQQTATRLGAIDWSAQHRSDDFQLNRRHMLTAAGNWLAFWSHQDIGIQVADGVDEIALALAADAWSRTYRSSAFVLPRAGQNVQSRRGLLLLGDTATVERTLQLNPALLPTATLDDSLRQITAWYGPATAAFVALQMEYPWPPPLTPAIRHTEAATPGKP